jgi:polyisoprenoid-binding protein YceI
MEARPGQASAPALQALLAQGTLAGVWILDPQASRVQLKSKVMGLIPVTGVFGEVSGSGIVSGDGTVSGTLVVAAASVDTRNARRDAHLRSADFLDTPGNPDIIFTVTSIQPSGPQAAVAGTLAVRGQRRPLSFTAAASAHGAGELWLDAAVRVNRGDYGLTWNWLGLMSMDAVVTVHAVFTRD